MNSVQRFMDWLDEAAGGLIRITYLLAGVSAVAAYFGAGSLPAPVELALAASLPWLLAFSVETHSYLEARRLRSAWQEFSASEKGAPAHQKALSELKVHAVVLLFLVAFSAWNQVNFLASYWHPPINTILPLPGPAAYIVRALVVPLAFLAAAFLAPMAEPLAGQIQAEARLTLGQFLKLLRSQRGHTIKQLKASQADLSGAIRTISVAAGEAEAGNTIAAVQSALMSVSQPVLVGTTRPTLALAASESNSTALYDGSGSPLLLTGPETPEKPPTGPGSPAILPVQPVRTTPGKTSRPDTIRILPDRPSEPDRRVAARARRAHPKASVESRVRTAYQPGMSVGDLMRASGTARSTANRWKIVLDRELQAQGVAQ